MKKLIYLLLLPLALYSCQTQKAATGKHYYDFSTGQLSATRGGAFIVRPLKYKADHDLQLELYNYNPLKYEVIVEDTSYSLFLDDSAALARYVVLPSVSGPATTAADGFMDPEAFTKIIDRSSCRECPELEGMKDMADKIEEVEEAAAQYQGFMARIEWLNGELDVLKNGEILSPADVSAALGRFLRQLNAFVRPVLKDSLSTDPKQVNRADIDRLEQVFYSELEQAWKAVLSFRKIQAAGLKDPLCEDCAAFFEQTSEDLDVLEEEYAQFRKDHVGKIFPGFNNAMNAYSMLRPFTDRVPAFITKAVPIEKDGHTINIYRKDHGSERRILVDQVSVVPQGGFKIDVAGGFFITGLADRQYSLKSIDSIHTRPYVHDGVVRDTTLSETFTRIYEKSGSKVSFGGMLYLHAHSQTASLLNYGISLGFGALMNDQARLCLAAGPTLIVGKKQRLVVNAGVMLGQVDRLSPSYTTDRWYRERIDNVPSGKVWKADYMIGLSWNL